MTLRSPDPLGAPAETQMDSKLVSKMTARRTLLVPVVGSALIASALAWCLISCFVDPSSPQAPPPVVDPTQPTVQIDPPGAVLRLGHSQVFRATATGDGTDGATIVWDISPAILSSFVVEEGVGGDPHAVRLIGNLNVPGDYILSAHVDTMETVQGTSQINTTTLSFGNPPPPFRIVDGGPGDALQGAVASGGGKSLVGFSNQSLLQPLGLRASIDPATKLGGTGEPNDYIQRYDTATGTLEVQVDGLFVDSLPNRSRAEANVAADCQGNAYWWDALPDFQGSALNRLAADDDTGDNITRFPMISDDGFNFTEVTQLAVGSGEGCDGSVYFVGNNNVFTGSEWNLWRLRSFDGELEVVPIGAQNVNASFVSGMAVDRQGRLVLNLTFDDDPSSQTVLRILPDASEPGVEDPTWMPSMDLFEDYLGPLATDGQGLVYVVTDLNFGDLESDTNRSTIHVLNETGTEVSTITNYTWCCPSCGDPPVCEPMDACATLPSFQNIQNMAATGNGGMLIFDNVFQTGLENEGTACPPNDPQDNARLILFQPTE